MIKMLAHGNGSPELCAQNLLRISRGEVPYERVKGLDPRIIDRPTLTAIAEVQQDAEWLLRVYEPRVEVEAIKVKHNDETGGLSITADLSS